MRLRHAFIAFVILLQTASCKSGSTQGGATPDGSAAVDQAMGGLPDLQSGPADAAYDASGSGGMDAATPPKVAACVKGCIGVGDCSNGTAAFDADNYSCTAGSCVYKGCNTDNECKSTFSDNSYICRPVFGLPSCVKACTTPADCNLGSAAFDPDNYNCTSGFCSYKGCNNDGECKSSFANSSYVCRPIAGLPTCGKGCTTPADCNLGSAAFDPDNYNCTGGICEYKGCNNDDECIKTYSNSEYLCR